MSPFLCRSHDPLGGISPIVHVSSNLGALLIRAQRAQYPLIKEYTLNYGGLNIMT